MLDEHAPTWFGLVTTLNEMKQGPHLGIQSSCPSNSNSIGFKISLRAGLHCGGEVHRS